jgi:hypothetical protein
MLRRICCHIVLCHPLVLTACRLPAGSGCCALHCIYCHIILRCHIVLSLRWLVVACCVTSVVLSCCAALLSSCRSRGLCCCCPIMLPCLCFLSLCQMVVAYHVVTISSCASLSSSVAPAGCCLLRCLCCHIVLRRPLVSDGAGWLLHVELSPYRHHSLV